MAGQEIDYLWGEVKYLPRPHAQPLRYRIGSDPVKAQTPEGVDLRNRIKRDVLTLNDPGRLDLYLYGDYTLDDGSTETGLIAVTQDDQHVVTAIRAVE
jgi:hypothetical protein